MGDIIHTFIKEFDNINVPKGEDVIVNHRLPCVSRSLSSTITIV